MDGYSVSEAASVLGVPIERVWELLARGVLSGTPEGETGMRVFLQPRPAPAPSPPVSASPPENGGTREPERELSPFRELLTEFRNLTERYGQALLALGESRGEVAALRSRVDLLEARMDLGLPPPGGLRGAGTWSAPPYGSEQTVVPTAPTDEGERGQEDEHRSRRRGPRRATESFAEALARAEDPSLPELPVAEAAGVHEAHEAHEEPVLPRELPAAETVPVADEPERPEPIDQDVEEVSEAIAELETEPEPEATAETGVSAEPEPEATAEHEAAAEAQPEAIEAETEPTAEPELEPEPEPEAAAEAQPEVTVESDLTPEVTAESERAAELEAEPEPAAAGASAEPMSWDTDRYTAAIDEPDWYEAEDDEPSAPEPQQEPTASEAVDDEPSEEASEETLLWLRAEPTMPSLPGSGELESALEALGAVGPMAEEPAPGEAPEAGKTDAADTIQPSTPPAVLPSALRYRPVAPTGPTGRAYRRLRRIFPD